MSDTVKAGLIIVGAGIVGYFVVKALSPTSAPRQATTQPSSSVYLAGLVSGGIGALANVFSRPTTTTSATGFIDPTATVADRGVLPGSGLSTATSSSFEKDSLSDTSILD